MPSELECTRLISRPLPASSSTVVVLSHRDPAPQQMRSAASPPSRPDLRGGRLVCWVWRSSVVDSFRREAPAVVVWFPRHVVRHRLPREAPVHSTVWFRSSSVSLGCSACFPKEAPPRGLAWRLSPEGSRRRSVRSALRAAPRGDWSGGRYPKVPPSALPGLHLPPQGWRSEHGMAQALHDRVANTDGFVTSKNT
jgi:hypothetical protein